MIYKGRNVNAPFDLQDTDVLHILFVSTYGSTEPLFDK